MYIDWRKAEEYPDSKQKVEGKFLLDLRTKVNDLERELTQKKRELENAMTEIVNINKNLKIAKEAQLNKQIEIEEFKTKVSSTTNELDELKTQFGNLQKEFNEITSNKSDLELKKGELENNVNDLNDKIKEMAEKLSQKDKELNDMKMENNALKEEIPQKLSEMEQMLAEKDKEIENFKMDLKAQIYDIDELKKKNIDNEMKMADSKKIIEVLDQINELMLTKGFITDKELEKLISS